MMHLVIRELHILCGALWFGIAVFGALFLGPAVESLGPDGGKVMQALQKRGFIVFMPVIAVLTLVSGFYLFYVATGGFNPDLARTHAGRSYSIGGGIGLIAFLIGALIISRSMAKAAAIMRALPTAPESERGRMVAEASRLRRRGAIGNQIVAVLITITVILMTIAIYA